VEAVVHRSLGKCFYWLHAETERKVRSSGTIISVTAVSEKQRACGQEPQALADQADGRAEWQA